VLVEDQATGYRPTSQHNSVPVPSQDKLQGLRQEGKGIRRKMGGVIIIIIIIIIFFDPGTQFPRKEKITLCNIKKYKNQAGMNLTPPPPPYYY